MGTDGYKYTQLVNEIISLIKAGTYRTNDKLPSIRGLAKKKGISINTVKTAYDELCSNGFAYTEPKRGFFISKNYLYPNFIDAQVSEPTNVFNFREIFGGTKKGRIKLDIGTLDSSLMSLSSIADKRIKLRTDLSEPSGSRKDPQGDIYLRNRISLYLANRGVLVNESDIQITNGCLNAVNIAIQACTKPHQTIATLYPCYPPYSYIIKGLDREIFPINFSTEEILISKIIDGFKNNSFSALLLQSLAHNPTGITLSRANRKRIAQLSKRYDIPVIEDDVCGDLIFEESNPPCISSYNSNNTVLCGSFSKSLPVNERIGWCVSKKYMEEIKNQFFVSSISIPTDAQDVLRRYLLRGSYLQHTKKLRRTLQELLIDYRLLCIDSFPKNTVIRMPSGGCFLWVELESVLSMELWWEATREGIDIVPGPAHSLNGEFKNHFRISARKQITPNIISAIQRIGSICHRLSQK